MDVPPGQHRVWSWEAGGVGVLHQLGETEPSAALQVEAGRMSGRRSQLPASPQQSAGRALLRYLPYRSVSVSQCKSTAVQAMARHVFVSFTCDSRTVLIYMA